ncbi:MAG: dTMP kinase [Synergistaceae bacterium]|jgi:dTMP kinase|nr:dTMP kinase [Synergistaceae bacterium]
MFIVLEGIDGSGKTTQCDMLADFLSARLGRSSVVRTFEPGDWDGGGILRDLSLGGQLEGRWSRFFLFMADRCEHLTRVIIPALEEGRVVICDRYTASTMAYQVLSDPQVSDEIAGFMSRLPACLGMPEPDAVILLDVDAGTAEARMRARGKRDFFETMGRDYFERVRSAYLTQMESAAGERWMLIDASGSPDEVFERISKRVLELL